MLGERPFLKALVSAPFSSNKTFDFLKFRIDLYICFRTNTNDIPMRIVADDTGYLGVTAGCLTREPGKEPQDELSGCH